MKCDKYCHMENRKWENVKNLVHTGTLNINFSLEIIVMLCKSNEYMRKYYCVYWLNNNTQDPTVLGCDKVECTMDWYPVYQTSFKTASIITQIDS